MVDVPVDVIGTRVVNRPEEFVSVAVEKWVVVNVEVKVATVVNSVVNEE